MVLHLTLKTSQEEASADGYMQFTGRNSAEDLSGSDIMFHLHDHSAECALLSDELFSLRLHPQITDSLSISLARTVTECSSVIYRR